MKKTLHGAYSFLLLTIAASTLLADDVIFVPGAVRTNNLSSSNAPLGRIYLAPALPVSISSGDSPTLSTNFTGLDDNNTYSPPDTMGAVGPNHLMIMINGQVRIQNRTGTTVS